MNFFKKYWEKQKKKSWWSWITDIIFAFLVIGLLIPASRTPIMVFIKELTNFAPSVSVSDDYGTLEAKDYQWQFLDAGSQVKQLADFKDKPIFINFWATWCPPCIAEMPSLIELQDEYEDRVHFILISHEKQHITQSFLQDKAWDFNSYLPYSSVPDQLMSNSLPAPISLIKMG